MNISLGPSVKAVLKLFGLGTSSAILKVVNGAFEAAVAGDGVLPTGGTTGQVLSKNSNDNYDTEWVDAAVSITTQYVLDGDLTPTIPAGGAEIRCMMGSAAGATTPGITAARAVNAPAGATPVHGQKFTIWIYEDGSGPYDVTFNAAFTPVGVAMASNIVASNGTINKAAVVTGSYNLPAAKWQVTGISYEA